MTVLNKVVAITASANAAPTLTGDDTTGTDKVYAVTWDAALAPVLTWPNAPSGREQTIRVRLLATGSAGAYTHPSGVKWPNGQPPAVSTTVGLVNRYAYSSIDGVSVDGFVETASATAASLAISAFSGTTYAGQTFAVAGSYIGPVPANLDYSIDGGAWTTLASGALTATNGGFSFSIASAPAAGSHALQVRVTNNQGEVSPSQTFAIAAATAPTNATVGVSPGNAQNVLALGATLNGSNVTQFTIYRGTTAGGESATPLATVTTGITNGSSTASASYTDSGLTNGTTYFYTATATNSVGTSPQSAEASGTPATSAAPTHYLNAPGAAGDTVSTPSSSSNDTTTGYLDMQIWCAPNSYTPSATQFLISKWAASATAANSEFVFALLTSGKLLANVQDASGKNPSVSSSVAITSALANSAGLWLRLVWNNSGAAINGFPAASATFQTSPGGASPTWTTLGSVITASGTATALGGGLGHIGSASQPLEVGGGAAPFKGSVYKALLQDGGNVVLANPNFTSLATGTTSFADTAATPNTFTVTGDNVV